MEVVSAALALVVPYLVGAVGRAADEGVRRLWQLMTDTAEQEGDAITRSALHRLRERPNDADTQTSAAEALASLAASNPQFLTELSALVKELRSAGQTVTMTTNLSGDAKIEKQVNVGSAGDITIQ